jgi:hypothetical protein
MGVPLERITGAVEIPLPHLVGFRNPFLYSMRFVDSEICVRQKLESLHPTIRHFRHTHI